MVKFIFIGGAYHGGWRISSPEISAPIADDSVHFKPEVGADIINKEVIPVGLKLVQAHRHKVSKSQ